MAGKYQLHAEQLPTSLKILKYVTAIVLYGPNKVVVVWNYINLTLSCVTKEDQS
jgi:hypothetical protein